ncbi:MAG: hypothetical protein ACI9TV_002078 [Sulfurimonas sp.]|jgi:hypothetical protein|uniref:hypothetical protein n=1 Tax=Sulfurimonas sp. TaxID=2022749 RepID=UPI0039E350B8
MSDVCLNDSLVSQYLKYTFNKDFDKNKIRNLLKYIHPFIVSKNQHKIFDDPSMCSQINNDPLLNLVDNVNNESLVKATTLKLQLVDKCDTSSSFTEVNIVPLFAHMEKIDMSIGATYENSDGKDKAIKHISALLSDAKWIKITDSYLAANPSQWDENKNILNTLLPKKSIDIIIVTNEFNKKSELETLYDLWEIRAEAISDNIHDRYIETDKIKILLSSGIYNLSASSNKDMTYRVKIKS